MTQKLKVVKRDGSLEEFNPAKIARVVQAAGLTPAQAGLLSQKVAEWASGLGKSQIPSRQIGDKVLEELKEVSKYAADLFEWYGKTKKK